MCQYWKLAAIIEGAILLLPVIIIIILKLSGKSKNPTTDIYNQSMKDGGSLF